MKRNTTQRMAIEQVFRQHDGPLKVDELWERSRVLVPSLNQATVYRALKNLVEEGVLTKFTHPMLGTLYERAGKGHHHHFYCRSCHRVFDVSCDLQTETAAPKGFVLEDHEIFLSGICPDCDGHLHN